MHVFYLRTDIHRGKTVGTGFSPGEKPENSFSPVENPGNNRSIGILKLIPMVFRRCRRRITRWKTGG